MKTRILTTVLLAILQLTSITPSRANAIAGSVAVDSVVDNLINDLESLIYQMETSASVTSFNIRSNLLIVLDNVKILGNELVGKTFSELSDAQKQFFENTQVLVKESLDGANVTLDRVNDIVLNMDEALSRVPGITDRPFVKKYSPSYILKNKGEYSISVHGSLIGNSNPTLLFGGEECEIKTKTERRLDFDCPDSIFTTGDDWVSGTLTVTKKRPWYMIFSSDEEYPYQISVRAIDERIGSYTLSIFSQEEVATRVNREIPNSEANGHCQGARDVVWTYSPAAGCKIDINSINVSHSKSSRSAFNGTHNVTVDGFQVRAVVRNNGTCAPRIFGQRAYVDGRGNVNVNAKWVDVCPQDVEVKKEQLEGVLIWTKEEVFEMPENTQRFVLVVKQVDGQQVVVKGSEVHKWFKVDFDEKGKIAVFRPKDLELAFN
ncbi:hypothetical protein C1N32_04195 [Vibrio diazotrophicus]|uniref:Uncharacterized protein n=1 Tax=Vibrio diazotrophicus TaxID=685 RepID=A0A2J8I6P4_VIBDI|nr:hypothetical protein [Vibrio diazotrophicus]PNI06207.1 hypothetical protein C1N32_04195 [Vibrio diazotrophicus]